MIGALVKTYNGLPLFARRLIVRAFFSTVILSVWTHIATYFYALRYGARIPLEGVPFLVVFASIAALILAFVSVSTLALVPFAKDAPPIGSTNKEGENEARRPIPQTTKKGSLKATGTQRALASLWSFLSLFAAALGVVSLTADLGAWGSFVERVMPLFSTTLGTSLLSSAVTGAALVTGVALTSFAFRFATRRQIEILSLAMYIFTGLAVMIALLGPGFDHLLRVTQYGGGLLVNIETRDRGIIENASLFLVSDQTVTVWIATEGVFEEFNSAHLVSITYRPDQNWVMPQSRTVSQMLGADLHPER